MRRIINFFLLLVSYLVISTSYAAAADLFIPLPEISHADRLSKKAAANDISKKEKQVGVNTSALATIPGFLNIDLFGKTVTAVLDRTEKVSDDSVSWVGHIDDKSNEVILVISGSLVQGSITYQNQQYQIRYTGTLDGSSLHILRLVDPTKLRDEHPPGFIGKLQKDTALKKNQLQAPQVKNVQKSINNADAATDSGAFVDVMVLWTPASRQGAGGTAAIKALVDLAFVETNQSYANSGITLRLRLAHKQEVNYIESNLINTNLNRLENPNDGYIDNIHTLRDTYKADLVSLFITIPGLYCGVADTPLQTFWDQAAFSVIDYRCAVDNRSFAHETGHNFSAVHDWRTDSDDPNYIYPYSHGHLHDGASSWRTIMSYRKCTGSGPCTRLNYWSNPDKQYNGVAMGAPEGSAQAADTRKTLNNAASFVANYRVSGTDTAAQFTTWDIDGNGKADALTDGLLTLRYLFGFTGSPLVSNAVDGSATRTSAADIQAYLQTGVDTKALDIDGDSTVKPLTDGLLVLRYLFGFTGDSLVNNATGQNATRKSANDVEAYLQSKMP